MPDAMSFDFSELSRLQADLGEVPDNAGPKIRQAMQVSAGNVKQSWRASLTGARALPGAARSIRYETTVSDGRQIKAEIGPELGGQGSLVGAVEFGTPTLSPRGYGAAALHENEADFQRGLERAIQEAEQEAGL